jgi:hypothetical protein
MAELKSNFFDRVFLMEYRGTAYTVVQDIGRDAWIWTVHLDEGTTESGRKKTREGALTAVILTIDRWLRNRHLRRTLPVSHRVG